MDVSLSASMSSFCVLRKTSCGSAELLVDFTITGTQVGTQQVAQTLTADLGNIPAGTSESAEWTILSSLQGYFSDFAASYQHSNALGGLATSLIAGVTIHELIHPVQIDGSDGQPDFLVAADSAFPNATLQIYYGLDADGPTDPATLQPTLVPVYSDQPNALYDSRSGLGMAVSDIAASLVTTGAVSINPTTHALSLTVTAPLGSGWNYLEIPDPAAAYPQYALATVTRSDGKVISVGHNANAWQTDRVFDQYGFLNVHLLHLLDDAAAGQAYTYTLTYLPTNALTQLTALQALQAQVVIAPNTLNMFFSQPINASSYDPSKLVLQYRTSTSVPWSTLPTASITLMPYAGNALEYTLTGLAALTVAPGFYQFTLTGSAVTDAGGNAVIGSYTDSWSMAPSIPIPPNSRITFAGVSAVASLTVGAGASLTLSASFTNTLELGSLSLQSASIIDLNAHDLVIRAGTLPAVVAWATSGQLTSALIASTSGLKRVAVMDGASYLATHGAGALFGGLPVYATDILVMTTYQGDANFDGTITADDYLALNLGFLFGLTGYGHGDFTMNGQINAADYAAIDFSYQHQSGSAASSQIALHTQQFGAAYTTAFDALTPPATVATPTPTIPTIPSKTTPNPRNSPLIPSLNNNQFMAFRLRSFF